MCRRLVFLVIAGAALAQFPVAATEPANHVGRALSPYCHGAAPIRKFEIVAREESAVANDRGGGSARAAAGPRVVFDPPMIVVRDGDCVKLRLRSTAGSHHHVVIEGTEIGTDGAPIIDELTGRPIARALARPNPNGSKAPARLKEGEFANGEQLLVKFQANLPGVHRMICKVHTVVGPTGEDRAYRHAEDPGREHMVATITVLP